MKRHTGFAAIALAVCILFTGCESRLIGKYNPDFFLGVIETTESVNITYLNFYDAAAAAVFPPNQQQPYEKLFCRPIFRGWQALYDAQAAWLQ